MYQKILKFSFQTLTRCWPDSKSLISFPVGALLTLLKLIFELRSAELPELASALGPWVCWATWISWIMDFRRNFRRIMDFRRNFHRIMDFRRNFRRIMDFCRNFSKIAIQFWIRPFTGAYVNLNLLMNVSWKSLRTQTYSKCSNSIIIAGDSRLIYFVSRRVSVILH